LDQPSTCRSNGIFENVAFLKTFYVLRTLTIQKSAASDRSDEALRLAEKKEDQASDAADLNLRQAGKGNTSNLLIAEESENDVS